MPAGKPARRFLPGERIWRGLSAWEPLGADDQIERWLAWSEPLWSRVVVELPREERMEDLRTVRRLAAEARTLVRLSHPAIPRLLDDRHDHPVPHLVLEHVEGPTLAQLALSGPLAAADVARLGVGLASCLHHVHGRGLVHLGIEPAGIVVRDGQPVLIDLGRARPIGGPPPPGKPRAAAHQAPERCLRARPDPRMDLFSLGTVLYELATGQHAGPVEDHPVVPARARILRPDLPIDLDVVLHSLLERDVHRRPRTALETLRLLAAAVPSNEVRAWPPFADRLLQAI